MLIFIKLNHYYTHTHTETHIHAATQPDTRPRGQYGSGDQGMACYELCSLKTVKSRSARP